MTKPELERERLPKGSIRYSVDLMIPERMEYSLFLRNVEMPLQRKVRECSKEDFYILLRHLKEHPLRIVKERGNGRLIESMGIIYYTCSGFMRLSSKGIPAIDVIYWSKADLRAAELCVMNNMRKFLERGNELSQSEIMVANEIAREAFYRGLNGALNNENGLNYSQCRKVHRDEHALWQLKTLGFNIRDYGEIRQFVDLDLKR